MVGGGDKFGDEEWVLSGRLVEESANASPQGRWKWGSRNKREISLGYSVAKVFMTVLARRLGRFARIIFWWKYWEGLEIIGEVWIHGIDGCVWVKELNILKAYVSAWKEGLWSKMRHYGVKKKFVRLFDGLYGGVETRIVMNWVKSSGLVLKVVIGKDALCLHFCLIFIWWEWWRNSKEFR